MIRLTEGKSVNSKKMYRSLVGILIILVILCNLTTATKRPHIIFILADDLGWYDVGFHGSGMIRTPNIDALAYSGLILNNYYVQPICTPSRSALMTGKHPIHTGMQHGVLKASEPRGLPLNETLLPEYLRKFGYKNYISGKWHLGFYTKEYTPIYRGFDHHVGFWSGHQDYFDHTAVEQPYWGLDIRRDLEVAWDLHGRYATNLYGEAAVNFIKNHNSTDPMFLYLAQVAVHSGNPYNPLPAPDPTVMKFYWIEDYHRRRFAAMLYELDRSVGMVVTALKQRQMLEDSVIVFSTDNGGPAGGFNSNAASNWPLRGVKSSLWEGGVRGAGFLWSPRLQNPGRISRQLFHITDWLPTILSIAGASNTEINDIISNATLDGMDMWKVLNDGTASPRTTVLHNIDDGDKVSAITVNGWKLIKGALDVDAWDGWYESSEANWTYLVNEVINSPAGRAVANVGLPITPEIVERLRADATVTCDYPKSEIPCKPLVRPCLFNIHEDPCEFNNVIDQHPDVVTSLEIELQKWNETVVPPGNLPWNPQANPANWDHAWTNFGDYI